MKFKANVKSILKPLQLINGVVENRQVLPILSNVLISLRGDRIWLTSTNLEVELLVGVEGSIIEEGSITVPARKLLDICRTLPADSEIQFSIEKGMGIVKTGRSRFSLGTLPAEEFPVIEMMTPKVEMEIEQGVLKHLIDKSHFSMANQDVRYYLNGLMMELDADRLRCVATDGHRLAVAQTHMNIPGGDGQQVIIPRKGTLELLKLLSTDDEVVKVKISNNHFVADFGDVQFTSKLIDGRFPDYERVIPKDCDKRLLIDRELFRQALTRVAILSNEKYRGIRLQMESDRLLIEANNPEQEEAEEEIEVQYSGDPIAVGFNVNYVLDAISAISSDQVLMLLRDDHGGCIVQDESSDDIRCIMMPMRI